MIKIVRRDSAGGEHEKKIVSSAGTEELKKFIEENKISLNIGDAIKIVEE